MSLLVDLSSLPHTGQYLTLVEATRCPALFRRGPPLHLAV